MPEPITITNHGPLITATNYWGSQIERAGKIFASVNAGAVRILLPRSRFAEAGQMRAGSDYVIISRGPWPDMGVAEAVELLWEDGSNSPYVIHLSAESFDLLPDDPQTADGSGWVVSVWVWGKGNRPKKSVERPAYWRRVARLPCLEPWEMRGKNERR